MFLFFVFFVMTYKGGHYSDRIFLRISVWNYREIVFLVHMQGELLIKHEKCTEQMVHPPFMPVRFGSASLPVLKLETGG